MNGKRFVQIFFSVKFDLPKKMCFFRLEVSKLIGIEQLLLRLEIKFLFWEVIFFREIKVHTIFFIQIKKIFFLGKDVDDQDIIGFEVYDNKLDEWNPVPEWQMAQGRYRYTKKNFAIYILVFYSSKTTNFL